MGMIKEFKAFAVKGNVMDMAVGIIIGAAFGKIVSSFVNDILMPPLGVMLGGVDFSDLAYTIQEATAETEAVVLKWGAFVQTTIDFLIIAFAIFIAIKAMNSFNKKEEEAPAKPPEPTNEEKLLTEIRDLLKKD
ncbi:large-conductance mechanosensitive channel protein MscL [Marinicella sp. W31]|uniref:large-conductance mechanosensitive channel protein MscL n=1 Tax=Marinicella sp. W31 TaxID=3023713 RepID=UPI003757ABF5